MSEPVTQAQDHDRRIGRLEGIAEQIGPRLDSIECRLGSIEQAIAEQGRELRQAIAEQGRQTNARFDSLTRWLVGMQLASLIALGTLILSRLD